MFPKGKKRAQNKTQLWSRCPERVLVILSSSDSKQTSQKGVLAAKGGAQSSPACPTALDMEREDQTCAENRHSSLHPQC